MTQPLRAIYRNGAFIPQTAFELPEGTEVEILVQSPQDTTLAVPGASTPTNQSQNEEHDLSLNQDDLLTEKQTAQDQNGASQAKALSNSFTFDAAATPIWELAAQLSAQVPDEEWEKLPTDLSKRFDHYQRQR
ncbi:antitoxin family protein [Nodosilinea sp. AN01ver1]|uniref:antitoxin family protein n=1 Tax=Nodosilinea sp. AN01ver1 TaxID=3423362 RepID=UPI003D31A3DE